MKSSLSSSFMVNRIRTNQALKREVTKLRERMVLTQMKRMT